MPCVRRIMKRVRVFAVLLLTGLGLVTLRYFRAGQAETELRHR